MQMKNNSKWKNMKKKSQKRYKWFNKHRTECLTIKMALKLRV